jgi:hypothetical protein
MDLTNANAPAPDFYTWIEFQNEVQFLMPQDADRLGMDNYLPRLIREAVIDLQQFIPAYRNRHETLYYPQDFALDGAASVGTLPPKSEILEMWLFNLARSERVPVMKMDWERRFGLVHQRHDCGGEFGLEFMTLTSSSVAAIELINRLPTTRTVAGKCGLAAIDPQGSTFYLSPILLDGWVLTMFWNGRKLDFRDNEAVPFDEDASFAVAAWCKSKIAMEVDRDAERSQMFMQEYQLKRLNLYLENKALSDKMPIT